MTKTKKIEKLQAELASLRRELAHQELVEDHDIPRPLFKQRPAARICMGDVLNRLEKLEAFINNLELFVK